MSHAETVKTPVGDIQLLTEDPTLRAGDGIGLSDMDIDEVIEDVAFHRFPGTTTTVCAITLTNGFVVIGTSACVIPEQFDTAIGNKVAYSDARRKIWDLEGYLLKEQFHQLGIR